jgi:hypothetical protein
LFVLDSYLMCALQKTNLALTSLNQWFYINQLVLNITKKKCNI